MIWLAVAIVAGLVLGKLMGFMAVDFIMRPVMVIVRWGATLLGAVIGWGRRLP